MFKVVIIDDEAFIRKGLVNIINWKAYDCEVCGEGSDGVEGLELMESLQPDIVFVDINMPEINGLEMIRRGKELIPKSKFIILTGYRDFSYLQEAIKLGAYDYILKPSKIEVIGEILKRATLELKHEITQKAEQEKLREKFENSLPILKEKLLYDLMNGYEMSGETQKYNLALYNLTLDMYLVFYVSIDEENMTDEQHQQHHLYSFGLINMVMDLYQENYLVEKVVLTPSRVAFVIQKKEGAELGLDKIAQLAGNVQQLIKKCFDFTVTVAMSNVGYDVNQLNEKARECQECLAHRFYMGPDSIILYKDLKGLYRRKNIRDLERYEKSLTLTIQAGNEEEVRLLLDEMKSDVMTYSAKPDEIKHYYWTIIYSINHIRVSIKTLEKTMDEKANDMTSMYKLIDESNSILEIHELLETVAINIAGRINQYNKQNINDILHQATEIIHKNFHESITLQDLASETYVSTYYLSRMFTKELNQNFVDYLNEVRMKAAQKLLMNTNLKTYEVSERVGINDAHYFSKLFRKYAGMTPTEYRKQ